MKKILIYFLVVLSSCEKKNNYYSDNTIEDSYLENLEIQILNDINLFEQYNKGEINDFHRCKKIT